jgi:DNA-binding response OmpR family regulator
MDESVKIPVSVYAADPLTRRVIADAADAGGLAVVLLDQHEGAAVTISGPVRLGAVLQKIRHCAHKVDQEARIFPLGRFLFDPEASILITEEGEEVVLTEKESAILICLAEAQGALISRRDLLTNVWGYVEGVETHTLETHIYRLRQKLETDPAMPEILLTQEQGYSLKF